MSCDSELLNQAKRREQLRLFEEHLHENLLVENIQAPGSEPDRVHREDRNHKEQDRNDPEKPFQNALKHAGSESATLAPVKHNFPKPAEPGSAPLLKLVRVFFRFVG